ncbi:tryptophan synthase subunit beta [Scytonema sp. NUACC26]
MYRDIVGNRGVPPSLLFINKNPCLEMMYFHSEFSSPDLLSHNGYYGEFGGRFIPEILHETFEDLIEVYKAARADPKFWQEFTFLLSNYSCRPTPLTFAENLTKYFGGAKIFIKREDLNHTGAHKLNNVLGQALLAKRMGKTRVIAETSAGQHGVATATVAAKFGLECTIYMGAIDVKRQYPNVFWMQRLGAEVVPVSTGSQTYKDAINEALRDWSTFMDSTYYIFGTACGPHPYPEMVSWFQSVIGVEARQQISQQTGKLPSAVYACVGGGSNAIGIFSGFLDDKNVQLIGVEAGGSGLNSHKHAARLASKDATVGVVQGYKTYFLQNNDGQMQETHSIAAGLDYVGVSPVLAHLLELGRIQVSTATDQEVLDTLKLCLTKEGLIPSLESTHAFVQAFKDAPRLPPEDSIVVNLSGRGDKDIFTLANAFGDRAWKEFLSNKIEQLS